MQHSIGLECSGKLAMLAAGQCKILVSAKYWAAQNLGSAKQMRNRQLENWQQDGLHFLLGLTLALTFFGAVVAVIGLLFLLSSVIAPSSLRDAIQNVSHPIQVGVLVISLLEVVAWNLLPLAGFAPQQLARRMSITMAAIMLFMTVSLLFSL